MPCKAKAPPSRGALPVQAETGKKLGCHGHACKAEGRGVGQLVKKVTSREDLGL